MLMSWDDSYSVKVKELDDQHKHLINLISDLQRANRAGIAEYVLKSILTDLIEYTVYHFSKEEELMKNCDFPGYDEHKKEHEELTKKVNELNDVLKNIRQGYVTIITLEFLTEWVHRHLLETDKQYSSHLNENGIT